MKPPSRALPLPSHIWIGRLSTSQLHTGLGDIYRVIDAIPKAFRGCVTTIVVGKLVIQLITGHVLAKFATTNVLPQCMPGAWDLNLVEVWPVFGDKHWPPQISFELTGATPHHIGRLEGRWKMGEDITK